MVSPFRILVSRQLCGTDDTQLTRLDDLLPSIATASRGEQLRARHCALCFTWLEPFALPATLGSRCPRLRFSLLPLLSELIMAITLQGAWVTALPQSSCGFEGWEEEGNHEIKEKSIILEQTSIS